MILGITGGISTGKSTAAAVIARKGIRVIDCDEISNFLTSYETSVLNAIYEHFGPKVFHEKGALNKAALAREVFTNEAEKSVLERILHPPIKAWVRANIEVAEEMSIPLVVVAPLLVEAGMTTDVDVLWVISCSDDKQMERLCKRSGLSESEARTWVAAQMSVAEKEKYADTVLNNDGTIEELKLKVEQAWDELVGHRA